MDCPAAFALALMLVSVVAEAAPPPAGSSTPWNAGTVPPPPSPPAEDSVLSLRVYGDPDKKAPPRSQPGPPRLPGTPQLDDSAYAVDVSAVMTRCPDGNLLITALVIGGQLTPLDNRCPDGPDKSPAAPTPTCDAKRWNCTTKPAN